MIDLAMKAFLRLDERLTGTNKVLASAVMSLMLYLWHMAENHGRVNWWDNQTAGEAICEIVATMDLGLEV